MSSAATLPPEKATPSIELIPLSNWCLVELAKPAERTSGGIWLAESYQENYTEGKVLAVGPGIEMEYLTRSGEPARSETWAEIGGAVIFQKHNFRLQNGRIGFVRDDHLVAHYVEGEVAALNEWVMVRQDPDIETASATILHAEEYRPKPMSGVVTSYGPGRVRWDEGFRGVRWPVEWDMGLDGTPGYLGQLVGRRVYWDRTVEMLSCGREKLEFLLLAARDLWGMEVA